VAADRKADMARGVAAARDRAAGTDAPKA
jgi:hypothetical protein